MISAARIRALRARLGWSQAQLARAAGVGSGAGAIETVRRWERLGAGDRLYAAILTRVEASARPAEVLNAARADDPLAGLAALLSPRELGPPRTRFDADVWDGRRVGILTLRGLVRRPDGSVWARAVCDCGRETFVRSGQVAPGARVPTRSCGCRRGGGPRRSYEGTPVGSGGRVVHDDGAAAVIAVCPDGHAWTIDRAAVLGAAREPGSERSSLKCPQCRVSGTRDLRGNVFGLLTVLRRAGDDAPADGRYRSQATWWCRCECGTEKAIRGAHLRTGATRSCGAPECKAHLRDGA